MITMRLSRMKMQPVRVKRAVKTASVKPVQRCGMLVETEAKRSMKAGGARGRVGPRGGYIREPSAPGTPPHVQRGALRASIQTAITSQGTAVVGPTEKYGAIHEEGGEFGGRRYPQRPFMRPALRKTQKRFAKEFKNLRLR